jgi:hypothetical protein
MIAKASKRRIPYCPCGAYTASYNKVYVLNCLALIIHNELKMLFFVKEKLTQTDRYASNPTPTINKHGMHYAET